MYLVVMVEHTEVSNAENEFMKKVVFSVVVAIPQQVAANVSKLQRHTFFAKRTLQQETSSQNQAILGIIYAHA